MIHQTIKSTALLVAFALLVGNAHADSRIKTIKYSEDRVIDVVAVYGYQLSVEFPQSERIESVAVGDSVAWQVTPNKSATTLFVKPVEEGSATNMTVVTSGRRYVFGLSAKREEELEGRKVLFVLQIEEPPKPKLTKTKESSEVAMGPAVPGAAAPKPATQNKNYTYTGAPNLIPSRVFDNGKMTYFQWPEGVETPAIFLVGAGGDESVVNHSFVGDFIVVDRISPRFRLRRGNQVTELFNDGFVPAAPGPDAPKMRAEKKRRWFRSREEG